MNLKTWAPLGLAVVLGVVAMFVAKDVISKKDTGGKGVSSTKIVVLKNDLQAGTALNSEDLGMQSMTGEINPQAVFTDTSALDGRVLIAAAAKGSPVLSTMLAPVGTGSGLQALIPEGMRAITVEINEFSGVAGYLTPGCRVDVVATISGEGGEMLSRTVVQNVKVQTLGSKSSAEAGNPVKSVTLLTTPEDAEAIELACATGRPRLVLRGSSDNGPAPAQGITVAELRGGSGRRSDPFIQQVAVIPTLAPSTQPSETAPVQPVQTRRIERFQRQVKIIRGGVESEITIEEIAAPIGNRWITGADNQEIPGSQKH